MKIPVILTAVVAANVAAAVVLISGGHNNADDKFVAALDSQNIPGDRGVETTDGHKVCDALHSVADGDVKTETAVMAGGRVTCIERTAYHTGCVPRTPIVLLCRMPDGSLAECPTLPIPAWVGQACKPVTEAMQPPGQVIPSGFKSDMPAW